MSEQVTCPKCRTPQVAGQRQGFGAGKAVLGAVALGPLGLLAGGIGSSNVKVSCLKCGFTWKAQDWAMHERSFRNQEAFNRHAKAFADSAFVNFMVRWFGWTLAGLFLLVFACQAMGIEQIPKPYGPMVAFGVFAGAFMVTRKRPFGDEEETSPKKIGRPRASASNPFSNVGQSLNATQLNALLNLASRRGMTPGELISLAGINKPTFQDLTHEEAIHVITAAQL